MSVVPVMLLMPLWLPLSLDRPSSERPSASLPDFSSSSGGLLSPWPLRPESFVASLLLAPVASAPEPRLAAVQQLIQY